MNGELIVLPGGADRCAGCPVIERERDRRRRVARAIRVGLTVVVRALQQLEE